MSKQVTIKNSEGQKAVADIVTFFRIDELNNDYVVYTFNQKDDNENVKEYASRIREENGVYYFDTIEDENEWEKVKKRIIDMGNGGE